MTSARRASSLRSTPKSSNIVSSGSLNGYQSEGYHDLSIETAIGFTTSNRAGFSDNAASRQFALCSGTAALLYDTAFGKLASHRVFRADASLTGAAKACSALTQTSLTKPKRRHSTLRTSGAQSSPRGPVLCLSDDSLARSSPGKPKGTSRNRIATCVALSPDGHLLAVGEVS